MFVYFSWMNVKLVKSKNAVNANRIMKFIDENELNNIWTIRCDNSETVRDRSPSRGLGDVYKRQQLTLTE